MNKTKKILLLSIWLIIFIINTTLVCFGKTSNFDKSVYNIIYYFHNDCITSFFKIVTFFGSTIFVIILMIFIMLLFKNKRKATFIDLSVLLSYILNSCVKRLVARPRPVLINLVTESTFSYPSGHTMINFVLYGLIIYLIIHNEKINKYKKMLYSISLIGLFFLIAISRIYLGAHYPSDIIGGLALGNIFLILYITIFKKKLN